MDDLEQPTFFYDFVGDRRTESDAICVMTRFGLRRPWHLLFTYLDYRRVIRAAEKNSDNGLIHSTFLMDNWRTCYSLSIWESYERIPQFGTQVPEHVQAANNVFSRVRFSSRRRPEIWSTKWNLRSVSHNLEWSSHSNKSLQTYLEYMREFT